GAVAGSRTGSGEAFAGPAPDHPGLGGEVRVARARRKPRGGENVLHRRGVKPLPGEAAGGRVEDLLAAAFEMFLADLGHGSRIKRSLVLIIGRAHCLFRSEGLPGLVVAALAVAGA